MIDLFKVHMPELVDELLLKVLHSGYIGQGIQVDKFEDALIPWMGTENVLTVNSGTSAIHLALKLAGVSPGDSVISTPMTCSATNTPIEMSGAQIRWADVNPHTGNMNPSTIVDLITSSTKAIVYVDWGGFPCELDEISEIAKKYGLATIEDAAHAFGAMYKDKLIGSVSDYTCFSLQAIKHITTIDGGVLCTKSKEDYKRGKLLRWYGIDRETEAQDLRCEIDILEAGTKWHMNDIAACIGIEQLKYIKEILQKHRDNARYYDIEFSARSIRRCYPLKYSNNRISSYWLYSLLVDDMDEFKEFMAKKDIMTSAVHSRCDTHTCFQEAVKKFELKGVDYFSQHQISIPVGWWVTPEDRKKIMDAIGEFDNVRA